MLSSSIKPVERKLFATCIETGTNCCSSWNIIIPKNLREPWKVDNQTWENQPGFRVMTPQANLFSQYILLLLLFIISIIVLYKLNLIVCHFSHRPKWMAVQAVHMFIETVVMDHLQYFSKIVQYSNRVQMVKSNIIELINNSYYIQLQFMSRSGDLNKRSTLEKIELVLSQMYSDFLATHKWVA